MTIESHPITSGLNIGAPQAELLRNRLDGTLIQQLLEVDSPEKVKELSVDELDLLAESLREEIVQVCSKNGGHLASSLGSVDLAVALHYVFDSPNDRIIWDVGHQSYAHKMLTGRRKDMHSIRTYKGLSGFQSRKESLHDMFGAGHASTSISATLGLKVATEHLNQAGKHVAVIGDGGLTGGMAFEALNHIGHLKKNVIVILNNNEISIANNVGALGSFISKKYTGYHVSKLKTEIKSLLGYFKGLGDNVLQALRRAEEPIKALITPGFLFECFGFHYLGPIDGNDIKDLIKYLNIAGSYNGPVLLHVNTQKGLGYAPAEADPYSFHGVAPFDATTGKLKPKKVTGQSYTKCFSEELVSLAEKDNKIVAITAAMSTGTGLDEFEKAFPERFYDVGICEQHAVTYAAGLAAGGMKPVVAIYSTFLQRAYDQVIHDVCLQELPMVFMIDRGGIVGEDGPTHHGVFDLSYLRTIPNLLVLAPSNGTELKKMLSWAVNSKKCVAIRYPRSNTMDYLKEAEDIDPLQARIYSQTGLGRKRLLMIAAGPIIDSCNEIIRDIKDFSTTLVDVRSIKPLDEQFLLPALKDADYVVTVEDNSIVGGMGSSILELMAKNQILKPVKTLGVPDNFVPVGTRQQLLEILSIDSQGILKQVQSFLSE